MKENVTSGYTLKEGKRLNLDYLRRTRKEVAGDLSIADEDAVKDGSAKIVRVRISEISKSA